MTASYFREKDLGAKQVIFMNGNEIVVSDGISSHSFVYDFSFNSIEKSTGRNSKLHPVPLSSDN